MNPKIFQDYPFGKYFVFDRNYCYILVDETYSDFVTVVDITDEIPLSMYQIINAEPQRMSVSDKHIKNIIHRIESKEMMIVVHFW